MTTLRFGTDGWRAEIAREFTFDNVAVVAQAIADFVNERPLEAPAARQANGALPRALPRPVLARERPLGGGASPSGQPPASAGVVIGYDARFLSEHFAQEVARVLAGNSIPVFLSEAISPTPAIAYTVVHRQLAGAVMITASHNPPTYNGIKFIPWYASPALSDVTDRLEANIARILRDGGVRRADAGIETVSLKPDYLARLRQLIDMDSLGQANLRFVVDYLYGAGRGYLGPLLEEADCQVSVVHDARDPLFGGGLPDPVPPRLDELAAAVGREGASAGLALDGDADRFGVIDASGEFISANFFIALSYDYQCERHPGESLVIARAVSTTHMIDAVAARRGGRVIETPVGFKYLGEALRTRGATVVGEESGGMSCAPHIGEKDGIFACLMCAEMLARRRRSILAQLQDLWAEVGRFYYQRRDFHLEEEKKQALLAGLRASPPTSFAGRKVEEVRTLDGVKLLLEGEAWVLIRFSGTEPLVRFYCEARSEEDLKELLAEVERMVARVNA